MKNNKLIVKGNIAFSISPNIIEYYPEHYLVVDNGIVTGIREQLPEDSNDARLLDFSSKLIIPGFTDLHIHAPQLYQRGIGMDMELIDWLSKYTFHQEKAFSDPEHAKKVYTHFADELLRCGTLHASIYGTIHKEATDILFEILIKRGMAAFVGKVNMDRNCIPELTEDTDKSVRETVELIEKYDCHPLVKPILTPRFVPTCSADLLKKLGETAAKYNVPVQSHLSENKDEVKWVRELHSEIPTYAGVYHKYGLFGQTKTLMAHCVYLQEEEIDLMRENDVVAVHCPDSNLNITSGVVSVKKLLKKGVKVGLGSDVGGGHDISMTKTIVKAIQLSKVVRIMEPEIEPLTFEEAFYMATKGNGSFFGKVGSFENGFDFDAIVIDDTSLGGQGLNIFERLQRFIYIGDDRNITAKFMKGNLVRQDDNIS